MVLVGKPEGKRALERLGRRREDNSKKDIQEFGWGNGDGWRALVSTVRDIRVP
jgi:hypothetical protein